MMGLHIPLFLAVVVMTVFMAKCDDKNSDCVKYNRETIIELDTEKKLFVNCLGYNLESGQADLVVLLDKSGSMWNYNSNSMNGLDVAKQFVKSLLSEVRVAYNATRVAVGTFNQDHQIVFNYIENPDASNHKCKFDEDFRKIQLDGGLTNIRGALTDALDVFQATIDNPRIHGHRYRANKVVLLLTDGKANYYEGRGSPQDVYLEADKLKAGSRILYTIGVTPNIDEARMRSWASHSSAFFFAKSFQNLLTLAHNIRGDPYEKDYETEKVPEDKCKKCGKNAECGCNLKTGKFRCACKRGYYGPGDTDCKPCEPNTYGDRRGNIKGCTPCPANSVTKLRPGFVSQSLADCKCDIGYDGEPRQHRICKPVACVAYPSVNFAYPVNKETCEKALYGEKCYYKCNPGYKLMGSDHVTCTETTHWTSPRPVCKRITCKADWVDDPYRNRYDVQCKTTESSLDGHVNSGVTCIITCHDKYYQKSGSNQITCGDDGKWKNERAFCEVSKCIILPRSSSYISVAKTSKDCFNTQLAVGDICTFECPKGFKLSHPKIECKPRVLAVGSWTIDTNNVLPTCTDDEAPKFDGCTAGIVIKRNTLEGKPYAAINFDHIKVEDNSGVPPVVSCLTENDSPCEYKMGVTYNIDITPPEGKIIRFKAQDEKGLFSYCRFQIFVYDKEKPKLLECPEKLEPETDQPKVKVNWKEPTYTDNCGDYDKCPLTIIPSNYPNSEFPVGIESTVYYTASDPSNNVNEDCSFIVKPKKKETNKCGQLVPPRNGLVVYTFQNMYALMYCRAGFYPDRKIAFLYICNFGKWADPNPDPNTSAKLPLPDCLLREPPNAEIQMVVSTLSFNNDCNDPAIEAEITEKVRASFGSTASVEYYCGAADQVTRRRRSTSSTITMKFMVFAEGDKDRLQKDPKTELARVKKELRDHVIPKFKAMLLSQKNWSNLNKFAGSFSSVQEQGSSQEKCNQPGLVKASITRTLSENCARCGPGTFQNVRTEKCEKCPEGTFQPEEGKTTCLSCPKGSVIIGGDTKNFTSCKNLCQPGEYSPNGLSPCYICPVGHYSDSYRAKSCNKCPDGTTTINTGSTSKYECGSTCNIGSYSSNGVEPCKPCLKGFYQPERGQTRCLDCPDLQSTAGEGSTTRSSCIDIQDCLSNPCLNGGNCVDLKDDYKCQCPSGYWGHNCEKEVNECALKPCLNNATCIDKLRTYECRCLPGTGGRHCDQVVKRCTSNTCAKHGKCVDLPEHKYKCVCDAGYTGEFCEAKVDYCADQPCLNEGFCTNVASNKKFSCVCKKGYEGATCEVKINHCSSAPCKNNGVCTDQREGYICKCPKGYEGLSCQTRSNMCLYKKCHNGGECVNGFGDITCLCVPGFSGPQCDTVESSDYDFHFQSRVSTSFASIHGRKHLLHFTLAFWLRTTDKENIGTPISYAVKTGSKIDDNALFLNDYSNFNLGINNETQSLEFDANDGVWHHVAVTWTTTTGLWVAYKDGVEIRRASKPMQKHKFVPKGGLFVIGEEQDAFGADFTPEESFYGDLSQLNIWDRVFSPDEIRDLASKCGHSQGNVVAWSDFNSQVTGNVMKSSKSLACDFHNSLRDFQYLKDKTLPSKMKLFGTSMYYKVSSPVQCAQQCLKHSTWCRTFTYSAFGCNLYESSILITATETEEDKLGTDLYSLSCVRLVGISNGIVLKSQLSASSSKGNSVPDLARLHRVPKSGEMYSSWKPLDSDINPYIQVDLGEDYTITGIATQGDFDKTSREFATSYVPAFLFGNKWSFQKELTANHDSTTVSRNEVFFTARHVRLYPKRKSPSIGIALRFELYGCPSRPRGTPRPTSDQNHCFNNPCQNGGTCYDLEKRYVCVCPRNYEGQECQTKKSCSVKDLDVPVNGIGRVISSTQVNFMCKPGFKLVGSTLSTCSNLVWSKSNAQCVDVDECSSNVCSDGCENSEGSFRCLCPRGKILGSNQRSCIDLNECNGDSGCQHQCVNIFGSYKCSCPVGHYSKGSRVCFDINECELTTHGCQHLCENLNGGYKCHCKPGFILHPDGRTCTPYSCPRLPYIANVATISVKDNIATYTCKTGYRVNGPIQRTCLPDATWSGRQPSCEEIKCNQLFKPEFGSIHSVGDISLRYGTTYTFKCSNGYRLVGSNARRCENINNEAKWTGTQPYCLRSGCPQFTNVPNGKVLGMNTEIGSSVRVQCNEGFNLNNPEYLFRKCQRNRHWSGPKGNNANVACIKIRCGKPPNTGSVFIKMNGGDAYQATAFYSCGANQCLNGDKIRHCQADGKWSGTNPTCLTNACCKPHVPKYSTLYSNGAYIVNSYAYVKCNKGYNLVGSDFRECQSNLKWSGIDPQCNIVNCGDPGDLANGVRKYDRFTYMSTIRYFCNPGFVLQGSRDQVCHADGKWSGTKPTCIRGNGGYEVGRSGTIQCNDGETCHWLIRVTEGQKIHLTFTTFSFKKDSDKAEIYDGQDNFNPYVTFTKALQPREITSNGHFVRIISDGRVVIKYRETQCGGMLLDKKGVITSPNYPNGYPNNLNCIWTIHRPYNRIELLFLKFFLQRYYTDNVTVTEGPFKDSDTLIYKYGYGIPYMNKDFADRWLWIKFVSDSAHNDRGFQAIWRPFEPRV